ncbi:glycerate kinase [Teleopsis dalmanni]|uniref:glycerate kinase n=1 Tax=Teleopsis dalmanni TaxID=139649 RepID=UPI0018CC9DDF|nr:glycerate kinase [Teleopsis dalmanni]
MSVIRFQHIKNLRHIFKIAVAAVQPFNLLSAANNFIIESQVIGGASEHFEINLQGNKFDISNKRCYVVGFGKAVLGMAVQLERALSTHLAGGVLSIPSGTRYQFRNVPDMQLHAQTLIEVFEGAANNQPDEQAMKAAQRILALAQQMTSDDVLFVLISGGGSALLPLPREPLKLNEKMYLIRELANCGATINELNIVRIALSDIKGGRLAAAAGNAHAVISLVISDIVGDPVELIASGPTCYDFKKKHDAQTVLAKYNMWRNLPKFLQELIATSSFDIASIPRENNAIYVVGDNRVATMAAVKQAVQFGYNPFIATTILQGELQDLVHKHINLLQHIVNYNKKIISAEELKVTYCSVLDTRTWSHFLKTLDMCEKTQKPLLLIYAGEPTVKVTGKGLGGRNQEMALRMSLALYKNAGLHNITFLSAGTDGIDGPTPAAGAIGSESVISEVIETGKCLSDIISFIQNNNSYNFYSSHNNAELYHIVTGHTGTNVMDLQLILLE